MDADTYQFEDAPTPPPPPVPVPRHTNFLDLTNGAGGERNDHLYDTYADDDEGDDDDDDDDEDDDDEQMIHVPGMDDRPSIGLGTTPKGKKSNASGKVIETGRESTGRWTKEEHEAFLSALKMYGKEWKKVAAKVKTRTVVQTRTHAQKYFQKLQKAVEGGGADVEDLAMGAGSRTTSGKKKRISGSIKASPPERPGVTSAAHLIANLSSDIVVEPLYDTGFTKPEPPKSSLFSPSHGFTTYPSAVPASDYTFSSSKPIGFPMKIVAPEHDAASKRGKFPEPSPAACGKRKLAEIAAARMLAGVAGFDTFGGDKFNLDDGTATPPPEEQEPSTRTHVHEVPAPPIIPTGNTSRPKGFGLALQIVNPESLGVSYEAQQKRRKDGNNSPQTPWEGQLAALVRYGTKMVYANYEH